MTPYPNSAVLTVEGGKEVRFHDGQRVKFNNSGDLITNTVMGTMGHQITGKVTFTDEANDIVGWYELGNCGRKKHQDFFKGEISVKGIKVSDIYGSYMGFFDIDGKRYWDIRQAQDFHIKHRAVGSRALMSDCLRRPDARSLDNKEFDKA